VVWLTDLTDFLYAHRPHSPLTADTTEPAWNGYQLTVACPCGVVFERWVLPWRRTPTGFLGPVAKPAETE